MSPDRMSSVDPIALFERWYEEAVGAGLTEADAMALATATSDGRPSVRYVLYRGLSRGGLRFFTNFESRKGDELTANPRAAVVFYWDVLGRQVRVEGRIERLDDAEADDYFASRPRGHQLAALASPQSRPIGHEELRARYAELEASYADRPVPRPRTWGGYRLVPERVELWRRGEFRLHERTVYTRTPAGWSEEQVGP
jgi:pyridoxamine 5'-phosphate oxidase